jgi:hypothetical protein
MNQIKKDERNFATCAVCKIKFDSYSAGLQICITCLNELKKTENGKQQYNSMLRKYSYKPCMLHDDIWC